MRRAPSGRSLPALRLWSTVTLLTLFYGGAASAVTVPQLVYDAAEDQLVLTIAYRGTNPDHRFKVQWAECKRLDDARSQILGVLLDDQADDLARQEFTQQLNVSLEDFTCRPAKVTIRTSDRFFTSVDVPARPQRNNPLTPDAEARNAP
jgi:hypothetical protein